MWRPAGSRMVCGCVGDSQYASAIAASRRGRARHGSRGCFPMRPSSRPGVLRFFAFCIALGVGQRKGWAGMGEVGMLTPLPSLLVVRTVTLWLAVAFGRAASAARVLHTARAPDASF